MFLSSDASILLGKETKKTSVISNTCAGKEPREERSCREPVALRSHAYPSLSSATAAPLYLSGEMLPLLLIAVNVLTPPLLLW